MLVDSLAKSLDNQQHPVSMDNLPHHRHIHRRSDNKLVVVVPAPMAVFVPAAKRVSVDSPPFPGVVAAMLEVQAAAAVVVDALGMESVPAGTSNGRV